MGITNNVSPACPACEAAGARLIEWFHSYKIFCCRICQHGFVDASAYQGDRYEAAYSGEDTRVSNGDDTYKPLMRWLSESSPGMAEGEWFMTAAQHAAMGLIEQRIGRGVHILDIGCGTGWFLALARQRGHSPMGVDVAATPIEVLNQRGFTVAVGTIDDLPNGWPTPDVVTLFEVLEHIPEPATFLRKIRGRYPRSPVVITVPSPRRWTLLSGAREIGDYPPHHLNRWTDFSIVAAARRAGYAQTGVCFPPPTAQEAAMIAVPNYVKRAIKVRLGSPNAEEAPQTTGALRSLAEEIRRRNLKRSAVAPVTFAARLLGRSGLSMLAVLTP